MKQHLAVFDLDETLTTHNGSHEAFKVVYADGQIPSDFAEISSNLDDLKRHMISVLNARNLSSEEIWNIHVQISQKEEKMIEGTLGQNSSIYPKILFFIKFPYQNIIF